GHEHVFGNPEDDAARESVQRIVDRVLDPVIAGEGDAVLQEGVADGLDVVRPGVANQHSPAVNLERVAARVARGPQIDHAAADGDGGLVTAGAFLNRAVADGEVPILDLDGG